MTAPTDELVERFNEWVEVGATDACWAWMGHIRKSGYPGFNFKARAFGAHRLALIIASRMDPSDADARHSCPNLFCVNPSHLYWEAKVERVRTSATRSNQNTGKTHCIRGHPFDGENLVEINGKRQCRICQKFRNDRLDERLGKSGRAEKWAKASHAMTPEQKAKRAERTKRWQAIHPEQSKRITRQAKLRQFGIDIAEYERIYQMQDGLCSICRRQETSTFRGVVRLLAVDHDHATGKVRGLLCSACNIGIGCFSDDTRRMAQAIDYLERGEK